MYIPVNWSTSTIPNPSAFPSLLQDRTVYPRYLASIWDGREGGVGGWGQVVARCGLPTSSCVHAVHVSMQSVLFVFGHALSRRILPNGVQARLILVNLSLHVCVCLSPKCYSTYPPYTYKIIRETKVPGSHNMSEIYYINLLGPSKLTLT